MAHRFAVLEEGELLVVTFEGVITTQEEREALQETAGLPGLSERARVLVDRLRAKLRSGPGDVRPQIDLAAGTFSGSERPRMAVVVEGDYDFGMLRMLELSGEGKLPHELKIFRDFDKACDWLDVDASVIDSL